MQSQFMPCETIFDKEHLATWSDRPDNNVQTRAMIEVGFEYVTETTMMAVRHSASANDQKYVNKAEGWVNSVLLQFFAS
jgi:hypothetical protein